MCVPGADDKFGPAVECPHTFDFTLLFEQSILSIGPSVIFLLLSSARAWQLRKSNFKIPQAALGYAKLTTTIAYLGISIALLALWSHNILVRTAIPSAALSLINAFSIIGLSFNEHRRSIRPSSLLCIFIICSISFDVVQARTIFLRGFHPEIGGLLVVGIVLKIFILLLESFGKRALLHGRYRLSSPEALAGIISRTVFWWLKGLFIDGTRKLLCLQDLSSLDDSLASATLESRMEKAWGKYTQRGRYRIVLATISCFLWPLLRIILLRLCLIGLNYAQPFLISRAIHLLIQPVNETTSNDGKGLIGATALIYVGLAVFTVHYNHHVYRLITGFRGAMVSLIFSKTLELNADVYDQSSAVTLMSTDVDRISGSLQLANEVWARCLEIIVGIWLLERQLGAVCVAPIIIVLVCTAGEMKIATFISGSQKKWVEAIQQRIGMTSTILGSMRSARMTGLSAHIEDIIQGQRIRELELGKRFRWLIVWLNVIASIPQFSAPLITFGAFVIKTNVTGSKQLSINEAFTSLAIIYLITSPAAALLGSLPVVSSAMGCFDRIQAFLESAGHSSPPSQANNIHSETRFSSEIEMNLSLSSNQKDFTTDFGVMLKDVSVPASINSPAVLHNISAEFTRGSVTAIIGPVGSGKSTLLKAILREMPCEKGSIKNDFATIGYCSQLPWLPNDTIQRAICGPSHYDETWYKAVVKACLLDEDFKIIDGQDQNKVGSQGTALSGGQKQRISIARAVYARTPLMLFDDIFSALDIDTKTKMTIRLFGDAGLLRQLNTTVIVTTNSAHFLPFCHQNIVLNAHGRIENSGSLEKLSTQDGLVKDLIEAPVRAIENLPPENQQEKPTNKLAKGPTAEQFADLTRRTGDTAVYSYYVKSIGIWYSVLAIVIIAAHLFAVNFPQIWLKWYTNGTVKSSRTFIAVYAVLVVLAVCGHGAMIWQIMLKIVPNSGARLHAILLRTVMRCQISFFISIDTGVILNRFSQDMTLVDAVLPSEAFGTLKEAMQCIASAALISQGSSYMALLIIPTIIIMYFIQKFYLQTSRQLRFLDLEAKSPLYTHFIETLEGLSTIRAFGWSSNFHEKHLNYLDDSQRPYYLLYCVQRWLNLVMDLIVAILATVLMALAFSLRSTTSPGALGVALTSVLAFNQTLQGLITSWTSLETSLGAISRTKTFAEGSPMEREDVGMTEPPAEWPVRGEIEFSNVTAYYNDNAPAIQNISLKIPAGSKIGICGRTGSGKSTFIYTILGLLTPSSGRITIDSTPITNIPLNILRARLLTIPQDALILPGSVRKNLSPRDVATDEDMRLALKKVQLDTAIESRGGFEGNLSETPLSKGQQQLLALARAIIGKAGRENGIIILDEASSNVDTEMDRLIRDVIRDEFGGWTVLTVAHRMESLADCDTIVVLHEGKIMRVGPPAEVFRNEGGPSENIGLVD